MHGNYLNVRAPEFVSDAEINLPSSKSISNRLLVLNFLLNDTIRLSNLSDASDTQTFIENLKIVKLNKNSKIPVTIDVNDAGTQFRFLTSMLAITPGNWVLTGCERMKQRPIKPLVHALQSVGATMDYIDIDGFPPLGIKGKFGLGNSLTVDGSLSSQYVSSLMLIAPFVPGGMNLNLAGTIVSKPYIEMTRKLLEMIEIPVDYIGSHINIGNAKPFYGAIEVESDWSAAAFFYALVSVMDKAELLIRNLKPNSIQGDKKCMEFFDLLGVKSKIHEKGMLIYKEKNYIPFFENIDFNNYPDLAIPFITACAANGIEASFLGLKNLAIKESNRIEALNLELNKIGYSFYEQNSQWFLKKISDFHDSLQIVRFDSHNDHRIAMSLIVFAIKYKSIVISFPNVVKKSFPDFWLELKKLNFVLY